MRTIALSTVVISLFGKPATLGSGCSNRAGDNRVSKLASRLYSSNERRAAYEQLLAIANQGDYARAEVIKSAIGILDDLEDPNGRWAAQPKLLNQGTWHAAAGLLGELKGVEAISALVKYLDYTDAIGTFNLGSFPAVKALVQIGEPAVRSLIGALSDSHASIRMNAALALGNIGGDQAIQSLEHALSVESDSRVVGQIKLELAVNGKRAPKM